MSSQPTRAPSRALRIVFLVIGIIFMVLGVIHLVSLTGSLIDGDGAEAAGHAVGLALFGGIGIWLTIIESKQLQRAASAPATVIPPAASAAPAPGWYDSPAMPGKKQWWDGARWTEHTQDGPA